MDKFDSKLDGITTTVNSIDSRFKKMEERVDSIDARLEKAEAQLSSVDNEIQEAKTEHSKFRDETVSRLETLEEKQGTLQRNLDSAAPADSERVDQLEATNKSLNSKVLRLKWEHSYLAHSSEIVVGGVPTSDSAKSMALVVLKTIDPELSDAEVLEARYMTSARDDASVVTEPKLGSILVTLCNSKVAKRLIAAKIIKKKLTTDQLSAELVEAANLTLPSSPSAININEYMPKELYDLRRQVYKASKVKKNNSIQK